MSDSTSTRDARRRMLPLEQLVYESSVAGDTGVLQDRWTEFLGRFGAETYWSIPYSPQIQKQPNAPMPRIAIAHNVPSGWHEYYREQGYHRHDPVVKTALAGGSVFTVEQALDVLHWIALGKSKQEVADILCVSASCVKRHCENAYQKLGVNTLASAVARAMSYGLINP